MTTTVRARSTAGPGQPFQATTVERREPGPRDVTIDIAYAGICHSDIHTARGEWGEAIFPLVPGHEISGVISAVGPEVTGFAVGDHAGVGCFVDSCRECGPCRDGQEQFCENGEVQTYNARLRAAGGGAATAGPYDHDGEPTAGGYSEKIVVDERYALHVPDSIDLASAAPLLCAGITTYAPLRQWGAGPGKKVGVVGLGGLGHMAVQISHAMGAETAVISRSLKKQEDGERLGADAYHAVEDEGVAASLAKSFDIIVCTVGSTTDMSQYLQMLKLGGVLVNVGAPEEPMSVPAFSLIDPRRVLAGSKIGGIRETQEMLDFCAEHGIAAQVEVISADQIDEAYERVVSSDVRYRFVIDTSTLAG